MRIIALIACLVVPGFAAAQAPGQVGYQGRLLKADGSPESGTVQIGFAIFSQESGGSALWSETQSLALTDGFYATMLGQSTALDATIFGGGVRYLELSIGGTALTPRQKIGSVPYALACQSVTGGSVTASSLTVNGQQVIDAGGKVDYARLKTCANAGDTLKWDGSAWTCASSIASVTTSAPLSGAGTPASPLALPVASHSADGYLAKGDWDNFTGKVGSVAAGAGLQSSGAATSPTLALKSCTAAGMVLRWDGSTWVCQAPASVSAPLAGDGTVANPLTIAPDSIWPYQQIRGGIFGDLARGKKATVTAGTLLDFGPTGDNVESMWTVSTFPAAMTVDLGGVFYGIFEITFESSWRGDVRFIPAYTGAGAYKLEYSPDNTTWTTIPSVAPTSGDMFIHQFPQAPLRYLRLTVNAPNQPPNAVHISFFRARSAVYGDSTRIDARRLYDGGGSPVVGKVLGGVRLFCSANSTLTDHVTSWGVGTAGSCTSPGTCARGILTEVSQGSCWTGSWAFNSYCYFYQCIE